LIVWVVLIGGAFVYAWRTGQLARLANYVSATREEMKRCTWPSWAELKGSTTVVIIAVGLLGVFTVAVDYVFIILTNHIT
jgi:preprotein translocase subunit SecE